MGSCTSTTSTGPEVTLPHENGTVTVNGLPMYYEIHGEGRPLVLLHGSLGTISTCFPVLLPALAATRRVIAVELQGHGHTPDIDRPLTYRAMAADVVGLLAELRFGPVDVVGYSMGGGVAIETAIRYPDVARRIVFAGGPAYRPDGFHPELTAAIASQGPDEAAAHELEHSVWHRAYAEVAPEPAAWPTLVAKVNALDRSFVGWAPSQLQSIASPVMLIAGDGDLVQPQHVVDMFQVLGGGRPGDLVAMPHARLAILPGTTHIGLLNRVDWLHSMILEFLDPSS